MSHCEPIVFAREMGDAVGWGEAGDWRQGGGNLFIAFKMSISREKTAMHRRISQ